MTVRANALASHGGGVCGRAAWDTHRASEALIPRTAGAVLASSLAPIQTDERRAEIRRLRAENPIRLKVRPRRLSLLFYNTAECVSPALHLPGAGGGQGGALCRDCQLLMLGLLWAFVYTLIAQINPRAFVFNTNAPDEQSMTGVLYVAVVVSRQVALYAMPNFTRKDGTEND